MVDRLAVALALIGMAACGGAAAGAFTPGALPRGGDWTGVYFSDWGRLELARTGDTVVGTFRGDSKHGRLSGSVNGNVLRFTWTQLDERIGGHTRTLEGAGQFRYYLDANGEHQLEGTWGYAGAISGAGTWTAHRSRGRQRPNVEAGEGEGETEGDGQGSGTDSGGEEQPGGGEPGASPDGLDDL